MGLKWAMFHLTNSPMNHYWIRIRIRNNSNSCLPHYKCLPQIWTINVFWSSKIDVFSIYIIVFPVASTLPDPVGSENCDIPRKKGYFLVFLVPLEYIGLEKMLHILTMFASWFNQKILIVMYILDWDANWTEPSDFWRLGYH